MYIIFSYPRQGTDWFMSCCGYNHNEIHNGIRYFREYFNIIVNRRYYTQLYYVHGTEINWKAIFYESDEKQFDKVMDLTWNRDHYQMTKENFSFSKMPLFMKYSKESVILYRHRKFTFPTSREDYVKNIYDSFLQNEYQLDIFKKLKQFCIESNFKNKIVLSHIIAFTFMFYYADLYNIFVINWEDLICLPRSEIANHLSFVDTESYKSKICESRMSRYDKDQRNLKYVEYDKQYGCESECTILINFIKESNMISEKYLKMLL